MGVTSYYSFGGEIIGEETGGVRRDYLTDALGSVTATVTSAAVVENTYRYKPYGEQLAKTGVGSDPKFLWNGIWGYKKILHSSINYVRARHYNSLQSIWISKDSVIFSSTVNMFLYTDNNPIVFFDYTGMYKRQWQEIVHRPQLPVQKPYVCPDFSTMCNYMLVITKCLSVTSLVLWCGPPVNNPDQDYIDKQRQKQKQESENRKLCAEKYPNLEVEYGDNAKPVRGRYCGYAKYFPGKPWSSELTGIAETCMKEYPPCKSRQCKVGLPQKPGPTHSTCGRYGNDNTGTHTTFPIIGTGESPNPVTSVVCCRVCDGSSPEPVYKCRCNAVHN